MRIALGLDVFLEEFADEHEATTFRVWGQGENWRQDLLDLASDTETTIYWNLTQVNVAEGLQRATSGRGGPTDWELAQFYRNPDWLTRTTWYRDGHLVAQPDGLT